GQRVARLKIERQLKISEPAVGEAHFLLAAAKRRAEAVERLSGASLRRLDHAGERHVPLEKRQRLDAQRVARLLLVIILIDFQRLVARSIARQEAGVGLHDPQRRSVELEGMLKPLGGFLFVVRQIEDQAGMHVFEYAVPFRAVDLVYGLDRSL